MRISSSLKMRGITRYQTIMKEIPMYVENEESPPIISFIRIIDITIAKIAKSNSEKTIPSALAIESTPLRINEQS
tara:strand:+ start:484 stop:708 length:225 start_codon:yes stop_codon:yes gene_type:complete